jgi:predicted carbohydrate-binding protein with CBM5 and CBM33 domain
VVSLPLTVVRRTFAVLTAGAFAAVAGLLPALPALAHGATVQPVSRTVACAAGGANAGSAACTAALAANGGAFGDFDNLRVAGVNGKDKQYIPDGTLCSGDLPEFRGLDLPRADWPATRLTAGGKITVRYRTTIPHEGVFRVYLTRQGYNPAKPLGWDDLSTDPIFTATNPPVTDGAYRFSGTLPADRTGRHVLYTVWQTTSTPDTYYSCSDVLLSGAKAAAATPKATNRAKPQSSRSPEPGAVAQPGDTAGVAAVAAPDSDRESWLSPALGSQDRVALGRQIISAALIVIVGVSAGAGLLRVRAARAAQRMHRYPENR